jgi:hypothetical protein
MKLWSFLYLVSALKSLIPDTHDQQKRNMDVNNYFWNSIEYVGYLGGACGERLPHKPLR